MDQQLVIKLSEKTNAPIGLGESPPILYTNFKRIFSKDVFSDVASAVEIEPKGYGVFEWAWAPMDLPHTKSCQDIGLTKHSDNVWRPTFIVSDATQEEIAERTKLEADNQRGIRTHLLMMTDYTQLADCGISSSKLEEFKKYRQALRDLPKQSGFPWSITYPAKPDA